MFKTIRNMLSLLSPYRWQFAAGQMAMLAGAAAGLAFPWAVREVFDTLFQGHALGVLWTAILALGAVLVLKELANLAKNVVLGRIGHKMIRDLRARVYHRLLQLSLDYYTDKSSGEIASRMSNDMNLLQGGLSVGLAHVIQQAISLLVVAIMLVRIDPLLTLTVLCIVPPIILISQRTGKRIRSISQNTQERLGYLMSILYESISGIDVIKAFVLEKVALGLFRDENEQVLRKSVVGTGVTAVASLVVGLLNALFLLAIIGLGGYRVSMGHLGPADLIAFILYAEMVAGPLSTLAGLYVELNKASAAYGRIAAILDARNDVLEPDSALRPARLQGRIELQDVSFSYDGRRQVLSDINCAIEPGETVALVGPSGVGKSTLIKLIPRFYDPTGGAIVIDGIDARDIDLEHLREQIAIVPQETHLFGLGVEDNIACGRPGAEKQEIVRAARLANAHGFISTLECGYSTEVGENGARLSGGQKQRIAIARAFLKDPRILILDEATSALDTQSEALVHGALHALMRGRTTLIIAHRLSTIENADKIVVLREGRILATGTHHTLLERCPFYRDLYRKQFSPASGGALVEALAA